MRRRFSHLGAIPAGAPLNFCPKTGCGRPRSSPRKKYKTFRPSRDGLSLTAQFAALAPDGAASIARVRLVSEFELEPVRVRVLPQEAPAGALVPREARTAAIAAVGGVLAGAATVAAVRAVGAAAKNSQGRLLPGRRRQPKVVASRSFLVDVHLLGR